MKYMFALIFLLSMLILSSASLALDMPGYGEHAYGGIVLYAPEGASVEWAVRGRWVVASLQLDEPTYLYTNVKPLQVYVDGIPHGGVVPYGELYRFYVRGSVEIYWGQAVSAEPPTGLFQYLHAGDFLGFVTASWTLLMRQIFWVIPYFIIFIPLYIKTESAEYCAIVFILLSGFFLLFLPNETAAVAMLFLALSLGFMLYKLVIKVIHWH